MNTHMSSVAKVHRLEHRVEMLEDELRKVREERLRYQNRQQQLGIELNAKMRKLGEDRMRLSEHNVLLSANVEARDAEIKICRAELRKFATVAQSLREQLRLAESDRVALLDEREISAEKLQRELRMWEQHYERRVEDAVASAMSANAKLLHTQRERMIWMEQRLDNLKVDNEIATEPKGSTMMEALARQEQNIEARGHHRQLHSQHQDLETHKQPHLSQESRQQQQHQHQQQQAQNHVRARSGLSRALLEPGEEIPLSATAGIGEQDGLDGEADVDIQPEAPAREIPLASPTPVAVATAVAVAAAEAKAATRIRSVEALNVQLEKDAIGYKRRIQGLEAQLSASRRREASLLARLRRK